MSVFEPYPMRDTVQHFCEKHLDKIKAYMEKLSVKIPLPVKCTIEERKSRKIAKLHFACQDRSTTHCLYANALFTMKTSYARVWIHVMFLALQSRSPTALSTRETSVSSLKNCWDILKCESKSFLTLVTSAFPSTRVRRKESNSINHGMDPWKEMHNFQKLVPIYSLCRTMRICWQNFGMWDSLISSVSTEGTSSGVASSAIIPKKRLTF